MPETKFHADYEFLRKNQLLSHEEIVRIASVAVGLGVSKLRVTGGEPLLDKNIHELIAELAALPGVDDLALTTNATLAPGASPQPLARSRPAPGDGEPRQPGRGRLQLAMSGKRV